jgi:hypothetical protein
MGEPHVKGVVGWPGGLLWSSGWVGLFSWLFSQLPGFRAAARSGVKLERPQPVAPVRARARTNELDVGKRRPTIGGEEEPAGLWLPGRVRWVGSRVGVRGPAEWSHIHPSGRPPGRGP